MAYEDDPNDPRAKKRPLDASGAYPAFSGSPGGVAPTPAAGGYAPNGGMDRAPGAQHGTGYVNLQQYLGANYGAGQGMAQHVAGETARQGDAERAALAGLAGGQMVPGALAGQAQDTAARARLAGPGGGGLGAVLAQDYGGGQSPYTSGMQGFDAFLTSGAGGKTLAQSANQYAGLGGEVDAANKAAAAYTPTAAAQPGPAGGVPSAGARGPGFHGRNTPPAYAPIGYGSPVRPGESAGALPWWAQRPGMRRTA